jgi:hypothetical protein
MLLTGVGTGCEIRAFRFEKSFKHIGNSEKVNPEKSGDTKLRGLKASRDAEEFLRTDFTIRQGWIGESVFYS